MRTTVRATCPDCGDIRTYSDQVVLRFEEDTDFAGAQYRFVCPECNKIVLKEASYQVATLLYSTGVPVERYTLSIEILERPREEDAAPISLDDLIDLNLWLESGGSDAV